MEFTKIGDFFVRYSENEILIAYQIWDSTLSATLEITQRVQGILKFKGNIREMTIEGIPCLVLYFANTISKEELSLLLS